MSGFWWSPDGNRLLFEQADNAEVPPYLITHAGTATVEVRVAPLPVRRPAPHTAPPGQRACHRRRRRPGCTSATTSTSTWLALIGRRDGLTVVQLPRPRPTASDPAAHRPRDRRAKHALGRRGSALDQPRATICASSIVRRPRGRVHDPLVVRSAAAGASSISTTGTARRCASDLPRRLHRRRRRRRRQGRLARLPRLAETPLERQLFRVPLAGGAVGAADTRRPAPTAAPLPPIARLTSIVLTPPPARRAADPARASTAPRGARSRPLPCPDPLLDELRCRRRSSSISRPTTARSSTAPSTGRKVCSWAKAPGDRQRLRRPDRAARRRRPGS